MISHAYYSRMFNMLLTTPILLRVYDSCEPERVMQCFYIINNRMWREVSIETNLISE